MVKKNPLERGFKQHDGHGNKPKLNIALIHQVSY